MRKFIVFFASGSEKDPDLGRMTIWAPSKTEARKIFEETYKERRVDGILTAGEYQNIL